MATETLRPNAAGDEESISNATSGAGNHWQDVDEVIADEDTTIVATGDSAWLRDLYNLPASSGSGKINNIKVYFRCAESVAEVGDGAKASIKSGATVADGTGTGLTNSYVTYSETWTTNPATAAAWQWAEIDALQIGVSLYAVGAASSKCTQVYVEIDYDLAAHSIGGIIG